MPFLRSLNANKSQNKIKSTVNSLRTHLDVLFQTRPIKRVSSFTSWKLSASMTVEAAVVLPLFLFFIIQVMSAINMIGVQSRLGAALHQIGNKMAFSGYIHEKTSNNILPDALASVALTDVYAKNQVLNYAGRVYLDKSCIKSGSSGISFTGTSIMGNNDIIEIYISYYAKPLVTILSFDGIAMSQCYYGRAWTGYDVQSAVSNMDDNDPMVYVTETGTVYHTNHNCTYLNPSITSVNAGEISNSRNQSGGKYSPCERCARSNVQGTLYITSQGSSYHTSVTCPGLKRTIYTIPLSQAGGRRKCSKCG
ncbi:MAG: pilus assembly protein [Lachnospiraceae bacterium]|nr:pilus assembly protein [Lachnospiraceae bacterium]